MIQGDFVLYEYLRQSQVMGTDKHDSEVSKICTK